MRKKKNNSTSLSTNLLQERKTCHVSKPIEHDVAWSSSVDAPVAGLISGMHKLIIIFRKGDDKLSQPSIKLTLQNEKKKRD